MKNTALLSAFSLFFGSSFCTLSLHNSIWTRELLIKIRGVKRLKLAIFSTNTKIMTNASASTEQSQKTLHSESALPVLLRHSILIVH